MDRKDRTMFQPPRLHNAQAHGRRGTAAQWCGEAIGYRFFRGICAAFVIEAGMGVLAGVLIFLLY
jgi:hypothetical protein